MKNEHASFPKQIFVSLVSASFQIVCGISIAYSGIIVPQLLVEDEESKIETTEVQMLWIVSAVAFAVPIGGPFCGMAIDRFGRINSLKFSSIPCILGWLLIAIAPSAQLIIIGRILSGFSISIYTNCAYVYIAEVSESNIRAAMLVSPCVYTALGILMTFLQGRFLTWRWIAWLSILYMVICVALTFAIPESPSWLVSKNRIRQAKDSLNWFFNVTEDDGSGIVDRKLNELIAEDDFKKQQSKEVSLNIFLQPIIYKPFFIIFGLFVLQQFSGVFVLIGNSIIFFKEIGVSYDLYLVTIFIGVIRTVMAVVSIWLSKVFGRRILLMTSALGMFISLTVSGLFCNGMLHQTNKMWIPVTMIMLYFFFASFGVFYIPFAISAELFPLSVRGLMFSVLFSINFALLFAALYSYNALLEVFDGVVGLQYFYAIVSLSICVYVFVFVPETHKIQLKDIENYFWKYWTYL